MRSRRQFNQKIEKANFLMLEKKGRKTTIVMVVKGELKKLTKW